MLSFLNQVKKHYSGKENETSVTVFLICCFKGSADVRKTSNFWVVSVDSVAGHFLWMGRCQSLLNWIAGPLHHIGSKIGKFKLFNTGTSYMGAGICENYLAFFYNQLPEICLLDLFGEGIGEGQPEAPETPAVKCCCITAVWEHLSNELDQTCLRRKSSEIHKHTWSPKTSCFPLWSKPGSALPWKTTGGWLQNQVDLYEAPC